jgi:hypothetical protein
MDKIFVLTSYGDDFAYTTSSIVAELFKKWLPKIVCESFEIDKYDHVKQKIKRYDGDVDLKKIHRLDISEIKLFHDTWMSEIEELLESYISGEVRKLLDSNSRYFSLFPRKIIAELPFSIENDNVLILENVYLGPIHFRMVGVCQLIAKEKVVEIVEDVIDDYLQEKLYNLEKLFDY